MLLGIALVVVGLVLLGFHVVAVLAWLFVAFGVLVVARGIVANSRRW